MPDEAESCHFGQLQAASEPWSTQTQGLLDWPQTEQPGEGQGLGAVLQDYKDATAALAPDTTRLQTQDLDWSQAPGGAMDTIEVPKAEAEPTAPSGPSGQSMDLGSAGSASPHGENLGSAPHAVADGLDGLDGRRGPRHPPSQPVPPALHAGSSGSSEGQPLRSGPSFDDDLGLPPTPPLPLLPEEQFKMEEIVASLRCMSFNLSSGNCPADESEVCAAAAACPSSSPPRAAQASAPLPPSQPRSPTFVAARRRRVRGRPRKCAALPSAAAPAVQDPAGGKRKRSGLGPLSRSASLGKGIIAGRIRGSPSTTPAQ